MKQGEKEKYFKHCLKCDGWMAEVEKSPSIGYEGWDIEWKCKCGNIEYEYTRKDYHSERRVDL